MQLRTSHITYSTNDAGKVYETLSLCGEGGKSINPQTFCMPGIASRGERGKIEDLRHLLYSCLVTQTLDLCVPSNLIVIR